MKTAVSHLGAGICQTVFMNSICYPRQQAATQTGVGGVGVHIQEGGLQWQEVRETEPQSAFICSWTGLVSSWGHLESRR